MSISLVQFELCCNLLTIPYCGFRSDFLPEWTDRNLDSSHGDKRSNYPFVNTDGTCLWQSRQKDRETFEKAMAELQIGEESHRIFVELLSTHDAGKSQGLSSAAHLPIRMILAETAHKWLRALEHIAVFEGAEYAGDSDGKTWLLAQLFGTWRCEADGVVLLFNRWTGAWATIYDIPSGCSKSLNYPLRGMLIKDDKLYISACTNCASWGGYRDFVVDLHTNRASFLESGARPVGARGQNNPAISNITEVIDASAAVAATKAANCADVNRIIASGLDSNKPFAAVDALKFEGATHCEVEVEEEDATYGCDWGLSDDAKLNQLRCGDKEIIQEKLESQWTKLYPTLDDCFNLQGANGYGSGSITGSFHVEGDEDDIELAPMTFFWHKQDGCGIFLQAPGESGFRLEVTCPYSSE